MQSTAASSNLKKQDFALSFLQLIFMTRFPLKLSFLLNKFSRRVASTAWELGYNFYLLDFELKKRVLALVHIDLK